jgi:hypothetical protein|tara:strand:+ start:292 stop:522 length:231 start_codon:yes stop_codon:yes gene_type:complete
MILNYVKRLMGRSTERVGYENIRFQIQKQILKRRYNGEKQNKLYESPPKFSRSVVRYVNLTSEDTKNVILLKKKRL